MSERRARQVDYRSTDFQRTYDASFAWKSAVGAVQNLGGLLAAWTFGAYDGSGDAYDLLGNKELSENGSCLYGLDGLAPWVQFNGTNTYLDHADDADFSITADEVFVSTNFQGLTMGCWIYPESVAAEQAVIGKWDQNGVDERSYLIDLDVGGAAPFFRGRTSHDGTAAGITTVTSSVSVSVNAWYFVCLTFSRSALGDRQAINVNGVMDAVGTVGQDIDDSTATFQVGCRDSNQAAKFTGKVSLAFLCAMYHEDLTTPTDHVSQGLFHHTRALYGR